MANFRQGRVTRQFLVGLALFLFFGAWAVWRQTLYIKNMPAYRPYLSANIVPGSRSTGLVRTLAMGYDDAVSVLLWIRTIQDFGGQFRDPFALRSLSNAFWSMATLSPAFTEMYDFGGLVIGDEGGIESLWLPRVGQTGAAGSATQGLRSSEAYAAADEMRERAMQLFELGTENDPSHYIHPYNAVYTAMSGFQDPARAVPYAEVAVTRPDAPTWVAGTIPYLLGRSGQYRVALARWFAQLRAAIQNQDDLGISIRLRKIAMDGVNPWNKQILTDALHLWIAMHGGAMPPSIEHVGAERYLVLYPEYLSQALDDYRRQHGDFPPNLQVLAEQGFIPEGAEPLQFFDYSRFMNDAQQLMETATPFASIPEEAFGLENYLTVSGVIPENPLNIWGIYSNDAHIKSNIENNGPIRYVIDQRDRDVKDTLELAEETARDMVDIRRRLDQHQRTTGSWPASLEALYTTEGQAPVDRGTGQPFDYDSATGVLSSPFFPSAAMVSSPEVGFADPTVVGGPRPPAVNASSE